jgi:collagenase-like PrtC family protease
MSYDEMERELRHLEYVLSHTTSADTVPTLDYWRNRLHALRQETAEPAQRERLERLEEMLCSLEYQVSGGLAEAVTKQSAHSSSRNRR